MQDEDLMVMQVFKGTKRVLVEGSVLVQTDYGKPLFSLVVSIMVFPDRG